MSTGKQKMRVSTGSHMSRRQPDGFPDAFIFSFQKDPSRGNPSVLVPEETACPARNPGRDEESIYGSWKTHHGLSFASHKVVVKLHCPTEPMKGLYSFLPAWGQNQYNMCELSGSSCENPQTVGGTRHAGKAPSLERSFPEQQYQHHLRSC